MASDPLALASLRVLDFSSGPAGGMATTVLADFGADVIKVEPPAGDRFRALASSPFWLRGKRSATFDLSTDDGRATAADLAATADVVVVSGPPKRAQAWGLDGEAVLARNPSVVHCSITGWGPSGPYADIPGYEGLIAAKAGRMTAFEVQLQQGRPVYAAVQVATHVAAQAAVHGILSALYERQRTGHGQTVESSLLQALFPFDLMDLLCLQRDRDAYVPLRKASPMPTLNYHPVRTSDGQWIQCGNLLEHLFYSFLDAVDLLGTMMSEDHFQGSPAEWSPETVEHARDLILNRVLEKPAAEWMSIFVENGNVAAETIVTSQQAMQHRDLGVDGALETVIDPLVGETTQIGALAELEATPASVRRGAPLVGEHTESVLTELAAFEPSVQPVLPVPLLSPEFTADVPAAKGAPLTGVTILDLSTIIAAPLGVSMLADLGARVIKIEPLNGDPFRHLGIEGRIASRMNAGKESICINLKDPAGQQILHDLAADADVLIHNFRAGVPSKLGIDSETLHAINPQLIWAVVNGYGPHGPSAARPATHPVIGAATGGVAYQAGEAVTRPCPTLADVRENARQIMAANEANPDPNTSVVAASAVLLALLARERPGSAHRMGQVVRINMQVANAWANSDDFLRYDTKPERPPIDSAHRGINAGYRLYPTADGWVFLAVTTNEEFARLCRSANPDLLGDKRFATPADRHHNDEALAAALQDMFGSQSADAWEVQLSAANVGCVRADDIDVGTFLLDDPHLHANGWVPPVAHPRFGEIRRWGPIVTVGGGRDRYPAAPLAGEHTDALLAELGRSPSTIADLRRTQVVNSEAVLSGDI